jgi:hypothetical protein
MGVTIESAYMGDERSRVSVLGSLKQKASSDGSISTSVDSSLLPMFQVGGKIELTDQEVKDARDKAIEFCGGESNTQCVDSKAADFQRERRDEKELESQSNSRIVKGRKLTVTVVENGNKKTYEVPEGQMFELGKVKKEEPIKLEKSLIPNITIGGMALSIIQYSTIFVLAVLYLYSILATYKTFNSGEYYYTKYVMTIVSIVIPFSGVVLPVLYFAIRTWIENMPVTN